MHAKSLPCLEICNACRTVRLHHSQLQKNVVAFFAYITHLQFITFQAQLKLADHLRKMAEQGRDLEGMDVDLDELRHNLNKLKKGRFGAFLGDFDFQVRLSIALCFRLLKLSPFACRLSMTGSTTRGRSRRSPYFSTRLRCKRKSPPSFLPSIKCAGVRELLLC